MHHPRRRNILKAYCVMRARKFTLNKRERNIILTYKFYKSYHG